MYVDSPNSRDVGLYRVQSVHENRIYSVKMHCGPDYPDLPPDVSFTSKINLPCVNAQNGKVYNAPFQCIAFVDKLRSMQPSSHVWHSGDETSPWRPS
jgi:ubiquitin-protein ligase